MERIGYHVRDYFLANTDQFNGVSKAAMAVSTYLKGSGTYKSGLEAPRVRVSVASAIPRETCARVGLGYVSPDTIDFRSRQGREDEGILLVKEAGETLYMPKEDQ